MASCHVPDDSAYNREAERTSCEVESKPVNVLSALTSMRLAPPVEVPNEDYKEDEVICSTTQHSRSTMKRRPSFLRSKNADSDAALIAIGWVEEFRSAEEIDEWMEVVMSLISGRRSHDRNNMILRVQQEVKNSDGSIELKPLHRSPVREIQQLALTKIPSGNRFTIKVNNVRENFIFRTTKDKGDGAQNWSDTLQDALNGQRQSDDYGLSKGDTCAEFSRVNKNWASMTMRVNNSNFLSRRERLKYDIHVWALQPPKRRVLRPVAELLMTVQSVFPSESSDYFSTWKRIQPYEIYGSENKVTHQLRRLLFFLFPGRLLKHLNEDERFACQMIREILTDAFALHRIKQEERKERYLLLPDCKKYVESTCNSLDFYEPYEHLVDESELVPHRQDGNIVADMKDSAYEMKGTKEDRQFGKRGIAEDKFWRDHYDGSKAAEVLGDWTYAETNEISMGSHYTHEEDESWSEISKDSDSAEWLYV